MEEMGLRSGGERDRGEREESSSWFEMELRIGEEETRIEIYGENKDLRQMKVAAASIRVRFWCKY